MPPPTRVSYHVQATTPFLSTGTPKTCTGVTFQVGDRLEVKASAEQHGTSATVTPTLSAGAATWTKYGDVGAAGALNSGAWSWVGVVTTAATNATVTLARPTGSNIQWGFSTSVIRGSTGIGVRFEGTNATASGAPSVTQTCSANSLLTCQVNDWNATDGATRTWRSVNGSPISESSYYRSSSTHAMYGGFVADSGSAGSVTLGLTLPGTQRWVMVGFEFLGTASGGSATGAGAGTAQPASASGSASAQTTGTGSASSSTPTAQGAGVARSGGAGSSSAQAGAAFGAAATTAPAVTGSGSASPTTGQAAGVGSATTTGAGAATGTAVTTSATGFARTAGQGAASTGSGSAAGNGQAVTVGTGSATGGTGSATGTTGTPTATGAGVASAPPGVSVGAGVSATAGTVTATARTGTTQGAGTAQATGTGTATAADSAADGTGRVADPAAAIDVTVLSITARWRTVTITTRNGTQHAVERQRVIVARDRQREVTFKERA